VLVIRASRGDLLRYWSDVRAAGTVDNEEQGQPIWLCQGQRMPWSRP
jgi:hypothetical protein